jgi:hypothetical protein
MKKEKLKITPLKYNQSWITHKVFLDLVHTLNYII